MDRILVPIGASKEFSGKHPSIYTTFELCKDNHLAYPVKLEYLEEYAERICNSWQSSIYDNRSSHSNHGKSQLLYWLASRY